jgi:uncharacterized membrane protein
MLDETNTQTGIIREISFPLYNCKGWMKLLGVMSIIGGALYVLTIFGIIIAWLPIWTGILLFQSASAIQQAHETDSKDAMTRSLSKLKTYFIIMGVLTLIGIIVFVLLLCFGVLGAGFAALSHRRAY